MCFDRTRLRWWLAVALAGAAACAQADVYVIGNATGPVRSLSKPQVADFYLGRSRVFPSGDFVLVFDQPRDSAARARFFRAFTGMELQQVNAYWSRLMFAGQIQPPIQLPNDQAVIDVVKRNPSAIGYVVTAPTESNVRILVQLPD